MPSWDSIEPTRRDSFRIHDSLFPSSHIPTIPFTVTPILTNVIGSERDVLHAIRDGGYELLDEAQYVVYDSDEPVVRPDVFYDRAGTSIAVFVDGPDHEKDYVEEDDQRKRGRLIRMGYRVVSITELDQVPEVWESI